MNEKIAKILEKLGLYGTPQECISILSNQYSSLFRIEKGNIPYWINLVEAMNKGYRDSGKNENGHTFFLYLLFRYASNTTYPILNSFIGKFIKREGNILQTDDNKILVNHTFTNLENIRHPDIYINQLNFGNVDKSYSLSMVFENKIDSAIDREKQEKDYIRGMYRDRHGNNENKGIDNDCYAFYMVPSYSSIEINDGIHDNLGRQDVGNVLENLIPSKNYILLSYKEDILPWLENEVLVSIDPNQEYLFLNIKIYIQYLKNKFGVRENINSLKLKLIEKMKLNTLNYDDLELLNRAIELQKKNILDKLGFEIYYFIREKGEATTYIQYIKRKTNRNLPFIKIEIHEKQEGLSYILSIHCETNKNYIDKEEIKAKINNVFGVDKKVIFEDGYYYCELYNNNAENCSFDNVIKLFDEFHSKLDFLNKQA